METVDGKVKKQKIFIVVAGLSEYPEPTAQGGKGNLNMLKEALLIFVLSKAQMSNHEFLIISENNPMSLSSNTDQIRDQINSLTLTFTQKDIPTTFQVIQESLIQNNNSYSEFIQIILFTSDQFMNSLAIPQFFLHPDVCVDFVYFYHTGYNEAHIFEVYQKLNESNPSKSWFFVVKTPIDTSRAIILLTAHPQQRPPQVNFISS